GVLGATQDENSILFVVDEMDIALKVQSVIEQRLTEKQKTLEQISATDEICKYKELLNDGIITEVEFEKKKNLLLNN
ncbi:SHOCT domain-containing protein, partial [Listeria monocytogenes]|nr:SHOCT domain-containing protein [Listeria monocytogenes]